MTPIEQARRLYEGGPRSFGNDLLAHLDRGFMWSSPTEFIMARTVRRREAGRWNDLTYAAPLAESDVWLIWIAVGRIQRFLEVMPRRLPWLAWHRRGDRLRVWRLEDFERRVLHHRGTENTEMEMRKA